MAKANYRQQKRQRELSRKTRQAERLQRRSSKAADAEPPTEAAAATPSLPETHS